MRLGEVHRARPIAADQFWYENLFLRIRAMRQQCGKGALAQARIHCESHIRGTREFIDDRGERVRQPLAAQIGIGGKTDPAARDESTIGFLEPSRCCNGAILIANTSRAVARLI